MIHDSAVFVLLDPIDGDKSTSQVFGRFLLPAEQLRSLPDGFGVILVNNEFFL